MPLFVFFLAVTVLVVPHPILAGTATFTYGGTPVTRTTTPKQDEKIVRLKDKENGNRAQSTPPQAPLTTEEYVESLYVNTLQSQATNADKSEYQDFCTVFVTLPPAQQTQIITVGGNNSPCPQ